MRVDKIAVKAVRSARVLKVNKEFLLDCVDTEDHAFEIKMPLVGVDAILDAMERAQNAGFLTADELPHSDTMLMVEQFEISPCPGAGIRIAFALRGGKKIGLFFPTRVADSELQSAANQIVDGLSRVSGVTPLSRRN